MRRIAVLTGSRGEWGYIGPVLRLIEQEPELDYSIIATNMHLLTSFGTTIDEIERDGFRVADRLYMTFDGYNAVTMTKSLASLLSELPTVLTRIRPDILLLAGDRGEMLMGAIAGAHLGIVVAHIQAGELSGNVDGVVRHAITKLAHIHFAANEAFAERVRRMGEQEFRVFVTGAPLVDELVQGAVTSETELCDKYSIDPEDPLVLVVQHPVTDEESYAALQIAETIGAVRELGWHAIVIYPNADAGNELIRNELAKLKRPHIHMFRSLPRKDYVGLMRMARLVLGNSSSGIMEAPSFGKPAVNIGSRQSGREQAANVINVEVYEREAILAGIRKALSEEHLIHARAATNPYGDGLASQRIVEILKSIEFGPELLVKRMTY